ncbi:MAG: chorismate mutase, partial [Bacillota bacterium]
MRAIRGAITVKNNSKDEIKKASQKLIKKIL